MDQKLLNLANVKVVTGMNWEAVPSDQLFAEKGKPVALGECPWNLEEYTGKTVDPKKCIMIRAEFEAPQDGMYVIGSDADFWYKIQIDDTKIVDTTGSNSFSPDAKNEQHGIFLKAGKHVVYISFSRGDASAAIAFAIQMLGNVSAQATADLNKPTGKIRKELHGANTTLILSSRNLNKYDDALKS